MKLEYIFKTQDSGRPKHCFYKNKTNKQKKKTQKNSETDKPLENLIRKNDWRGKHTVVSEKRIKANAIISKMKNKQL